MLVSKLTRISICSPSPSAASPNQSPPSSISDVLDVLTGSNPQQAAHPQTSAGQQEGTHAARVPWTAAELRERANSQNSNHHSNKEAAAATAVAAAAAKTVDPLPASAASAAAATAKPPQPQPSSATTAAPKQSPDSAPASTKKKSSAAVPADLPAASSKNETQTGVGQESGRGDDALKREALASIKWDERQVVWKASRPCELVYVSCCPFHFILCKHMHAQAEHIPVCM